MKLLLPIFILIFVIVGFTQSETNTDYIKIKVKQGDTFYTIAEKYGVDVHDLAQANGKRVDERLKQGEFLIIPANILTPTPNPTPTPTPNPIPIQTPLQKTDLINPKLLPEICSVGLKAIPNVRTLMLGISRTDLPFTFSSCARSDAVSCLFRVEEIKENEISKGIDAILLEFDLITNKLASISVIYDDSIKWDSLREFADVIAKSLQIPSDKWISTIPQTKTSKYEKLKYSCSNYEIEVRMVDDLRPELVISKTETLLKFERNLIQQEKKKEFKP